LIVVVVTEPVEGHGSARPLLLAFSDFLAAWSRIMASHNPGKLRDVSRVQPDIADLLALSEAFIKGEHPVATAILGAGLVEHHLEQLLRSKIKRKDDKTWEMLVASNGPLNSFYSKIRGGPTS
jgi:hypothetical protein